VGSHDNGTYIVDLTESRSLEMNIRSLLLAATLTLTLPITSQAQVDSSNYSETASAILSAGSTSAKIRSLKSVPSIGIVRVQFGFVPRLSNDGENTSTLLISAERNGAGIAKLRSALASNSVTRQALVQQGISISRIIGANVSSNGSLRLFVK
jgi:hypothetical protein